VQASDLLDVASTPGRRTLEGLRTNVSIGIQYLRAWLGGNGAAGIDNLMEDAATAEISRSQVWQWLHNDVTLESGDRVTPDLVADVIEDEAASLREGVGAESFDTDPTWATARRLFETAVLGDVFPDFLTVPAYEAVLAAEGS